MSAFNLDTPEKVRDVCLHFKGEAVALGAMDVWYFPNWESCQKCSTVLGALGDTLVVVSERITKGRTLVLTWRTIDDLRQIAAAA